MIAFVLLLGVLAVAVAYVTYGRWLERAFGIERERPTPAHEQYDGLDFVLGARPFMIGFRGQWMWLAASRHGPNHCWNRVTR